MPQSTWRLEGHYIKATVYPKDSSEARESVLDLDLCCRLSSTFSKQFFLTYICAPDDLDNPNSDHLLKKKLSQEENTQVTDTGNGNLHCKKVLKGIFWDSDYESDFDANTCLRYSDDGRIEFVHRPYVDDTPKWAKMVLKVLGSYANSQKNVGGLGPVGKELEKQMNKLVDEFQDYIQHKTLDADVKEWLKGTYVDESGKLVRRGT